MVATLTVTLVDGTRVVVPDSLDLITPYVLREQHDWFEDEIKFLRKLLRPGMKVIDVGANHGVYALSMARTVTSAGRVWAFEPASGTAALLEQGVAANGYGHVTVERSALSSARGTAQLALNDHSELNALVRGAPAPGASETVPVTTLDDCMEAGGWHDVDFLKLDAEGEEAAILEGGARFFAEQSPLVQYEIKAGKALHLDLVRAFSAMGYDSYRLAPGLDLLIPFDAATPDPYLLNVFCCKRERADRLSASGLLVHADESRQREPVLRRIREKTGDRSRWNWRSTLAGLPYAEKLGGRWQRSAGAARADTEQALACYGLGRDRAEPGVERWLALESALERLNRLCESGGPQLMLQLCSAARVAKDYGARGIAVSALDYLCGMLDRRLPLEPYLPFLPPAERFERIPPGDAPERWMLAAALEEFERLVAYSSFYTGSAARERLERIRELGYDDGEMQRRLELLRRREQQRAFRRN